MRKWILYIILTILLTTIVSGLEDCKNKMTQKDLPCLIIGSFDYGSACNTFNMDIYDNNGSLLETREMSDYSFTGLCNVTFNYTTLGTYLFNNSAGDRGRLIVEVGDDELTSLSVTILVLGITFVMFWIPAKFTLSKTSRFADLLIKRSMILLGLFLLSLDIVIIVTMADVAGLGVNRELFRYLWLVNWTIYGFMIYLFFKTLVNALKLWKWDKKSARMGDDLKIGSGGDMI